jgi:hypothetical protein
VDHEKVFYELLEKKVKVRKLADVENNRLKEELKYIKKYNLYSLFLLMTEITELLNKEGIKHCAVRPLAESYIAHLVGVSLVNPLEFGLEPERYFDDFRVSYIDYRCKPERYRKEIITATKNAYNRRLKDEKITKDEYKRIRGEVRPRNHFAVAYDDLSQIEYLLMDYYGSGNVANPLRPSCTNKPELGLSFGQRATTVKAFLPDNVCQTNNIGISFKGDFPLIDCAFFKCAFYGIATVVFDDSLCEKIQSDSDLSDKETLKRIVGIDDL